VAQAQTLWIEGPAGKLEAAARIENEPRGAVVLAHPHPLYGGTMHNPVVFHADRELNRRGTDDAAIQLPRASKEATASTTTGAARSATLPPLPRTLAPWPPACR
jgi:hypothetical protein